MQGYQKLAVLDTTVFLLNGGSFNKNGRKHLLDSTGAALSHFIAGALTRTPADGIPFYSRDEVMAIDSVEKSHLPLYTADSLTDGVYMHLNSFLQQKPDYTRFLATEEEGKIVDVQAAADSGRSVIHSEAGVFALVKNGRAYIFTRDGRKPLKKMGNDFYYVGKIRVAADNLSNLGNLASWATNLASMGGFRLLAVWNLTTKKPFLMKMDYTNGQFVPVKQVEKE